MFAYLYIHQLEPEREAPEPHVLWSHTLCDVFMWLHLRLMEDKTLTWSKLLQHWESTWYVACTKAGITMAPMTYYRNRGVRHLHKLFDDLPSEMLVFVKYPYTREYKGWTIVGHVPVVRIIETPGRGRKGRRVEVISLDWQARSAPDAFCVNRRVDLLLDRYGIEAEIRNQFDKLASDIVPMLYLPALAKTVRLGYTASNFREALTWMEAALESIRLGLFYPRAGAHCRACLFRSTCDASHVSIRALERPGAVQRDLED
jgi:hypothetical protein